MNQCILGIKCDKLFLYIVMLQSGICQQAGRPFTKPPLLQESSLTDGGSPNLLDLVEEGPCREENSFTHDCTLVLFKQLIQTGSVLLLLPFSSVLGFTLYEDRGDGRAATHQLYSSAKEAWYALMLYTQPPHTAL